MEETINDVKSELTKRLAGKRVALLGIGNVDKGDDGFGVHMARALKGKLKDTAVFECGTAPENYLGPIVRSNPQVLLMIDAANLGAEPGHMHIVEEKDISTLGLSTHDTSLTLSITYLKKSLKNPDIFLLGIQPKNTNMNSDMSEELKGYLIELEAIFLEILS